MYISAKRALFFLIFAIVTSLQCATSASAAAGSRLHTQLEKTNAARPTQSRNDVARLYELRDYQPAWSEQTAALALKTLKASGEEGINPANYRVPKRAKGANAAALWDIQLTAAVLRYARDVRTGRMDPKRVYSDVDLPKTDFDVADQLNTALAQGSLARFLRELPPQRGEYAYLRDALAHYRAVAKNPWPALPPMAGAVDTLSLDAQKKLWTRLAAEDPRLSPLGEEEEPSLAELDAALRRYQERHALDADGVIGPNTIAVMNVSIARRIALIKINMERWRWLPHIPDKRYVEVNVADASLKAVKDDRVMLTSAVVIGHRQSKTPILATGIRSVILNPAWPVPASVASNEIFPKLLANNAYLQERNMILVNGPVGDPHGLTLNWRQVRRYPFPYLIQQQPGEENALGAYLLDMPNRFDVYLHDTPSKDLFTSAARMFSHGCVRVERIAELANFVVSGDPAAEIPQHINLSRDKMERLFIAPMVPVYFVYWTAFKGPDGGVAFREDIYGRDASLMAALESR